jgi:hypothetical protein
LDVAADAVVEHRPSPGLGQPRCIIEVAVGNPITSHILPVPLPFDRELASRLSLNIHFPRGRSNSQAIGSATRAWRELTEKDAKIIFRAVQKLDRTARDAVEEQAMALWSTEEVTQAVEKHVETLLHTYII